MGETRLAVVRSFLNGRLELGANGMLARGYTGQTTETFAPNWVIRTSAVLRRGRDRHCQRLRLRDHGAKRRHTHGFVGGRVHLLAVQSGKVRAAH